MTWLPERAAEKGDELSAVRPPLLPMVELVTVSPFTAKKNRPVGLTAGMIELEGADGGLPR